MLISMCFFLLSSHDRCSAFPSVDVGPKQYEASVATGDAGQILTSVEVGRGDGSPWAV